MYTHELETDHEVLRTEYAEKSTALMSHESAVLYYKRRGDLFVSLVKDGSVIIAREGHLTCSHWGSANSEALSDGWTRFTFKMPSEKMTLVHKRISDLFAKCVKYELPEPRIQPVTSEVIEHDGFIYELSTLTVDCFLNPSYSDWRLAAVVHYLPEGETLIRHNIGWLGETIPEEFRTPDATRCDHCGVRHTRKLSFVVYNEQTSEFAQIGKACMADPVWLGPGAGGKILSFAKWIERINSVILDDTLYERPTAEYGYSTLEFLSYCATSIRINGFHKANSATPTWQDAEKKLQYDRMVMRTDPSFQGLRQSRDIQMAKDALSWASNLQDQDCTDDFVRNLRAIANSPYLGRGAYACKVGAALIPQYERSLNPPEAQSVQAQAPASHFGTVGTQFRDTVVRLDMDRVLQGDYGPYHLVKMTVQSTGAQLTWFAKTVPREALVGRDYVLQGIVKKHDYYQGKPSTIVWKCKLEEVERGVPDNIVPFPERARPTIDNSNPLAPRVEISDKAIKDAEPSERFEQLELE